MVQDYMFQHLSQIIYIPFIRNFGENKMRTVKIYLIIIVLTQCLYSQQRGYDMEILPQTTHFSGGTEIVFKIEPASGKTSWCSSLGVWYIETNPSTSTQTITGNSWGSTDAYGFNVCHHNAGYPYFWLTKNKMTITHDQHEKSGGKTRTTSTYFYIDFRLAWFVHCPA